MIWLLQQILCAIGQIGAAVVNTLVFSINGLILLAGTMLAGILALLPAMPDPIDPPDSEVLDFINWVIPLGPLFVFCSTALVMFGIFMGVKVLLTWFKAL